jgi:hypothetical protein
MFDSIFHSALPFLQIAANSTVPISVPPEVISGAAQQLSTNDTTNAALGITGIATGIGVAIKSAFSDKHQKTNERDLDFDNEKLRELLDIDNNLTLKNPTKTRAEILNMPVYPDKPALTKTLAQAYADDYEEYKEYNIKAYYQKK